MPNGKKGEKRITFRVSRKQILIELLALLILSIICMLFIRKDYVERPGIMNWKAVKTLDRTTSSITLQWKDTRNTNHYSIYYKKYGKEYDDWQKVIVENNGDAISKVKLRNLDEGVSYCVVMRADNEDRKGFSTKGKVFSTRESQKITVKKSRTKLKTAENFKLNAKAKTPMSYESSNKKVVTVDSMGKVKIKGAGEATITVKARESYHYAGDTERVKVLILDTEPVKVSKAKAQVIYTLTEKNCKALFSVRRNGTPQSFAYTGDKYLVAYNGGVNGIAAYSVKGKQLYTVNTSALGHANGFTYCDKTGLCYGMRGYSNRVDTFNPKTKKFGSTSAAYGAAGIAYDRIEKKMYTTSTAGIRRYSGDGKFKHEKMISNVSHSIYVHTQDSGAHAGIVMRCMSGSNKHGVNYIDLYSISDEMYLGSLFTSIGEVESAIVDDEGYLELLINSRKDYIWKTPINIEDMAE